MKRSISFVVISLWLVLALMIPAGLAMADDATPVPGFKSYTVKPGDSWGRLAIRYGTTIDKLKQVNNTTLDILQIGQVVLVPDYTPPTGPIVVPGRPAGLPAGSITLTGSGATFPAPLYASWIFTYQSVDPVAAINYQPTGSGAGKKAIIDRTVDFAGSDALVTDAEYAAGGDLQMFPIVAGAVVPAFNVTDTAGQKVQELTFSRAVLANIFLGKITKWNDPAIQSLNSKVLLPNKAITVAHRSDGSGTTDIFTKALSAFSTEWASKVGHGQTVQWPTGLGGSGNAGVAAIIKNTPASIGYVELAYAVSNKLSYGLMINKSNATVRANGQSIVSAMSDFSGGFSAKLTEDIVDAPGARSWPIAAYTYLVLHLKQTDCAKAGTLLTYMQWTLTDPVAGGIATSLGYAQLPGEVRAQTLSRMKTVTCNGAPVLP